MFSFYTLCLDSRIKKKCYAQSYTVLLSCSLSCYGMAGSQPAFVRFCWPHPHIPQTRSDMLFGTFSIINAIDSRGATCTCRLMTSFLPYVRTVSLIYSINTCSNARLDPLQNSSGSFCYTRLGVNDCRSVAPLHRVAVPAFFIGFAWVEAGGNLPSGIFVHGDEGI